MVCREVQVLHRSTERHVPRSKPELRGHTDNSTGYIRYGILSLPSPAIFALAFWAEYALSIGQSACTGERGEKREKRRTELVERAKVLWIACFNGGHPCTAGAS